MLPSIRKFAFWLNKAECTLLKFDSLTNVDLKMPISDCILEGTFLGEFNSQEREKKINESLVA